MRPWLLAVPLPPVNITTLSTSDAINISWTGAPTSQQQSYKVQYYDTASPQLQNSQDSIEDTLRIVGLEPGHEYNITLYAISHSWWSEGAAFSVTTGALVLTETLTNACFSPWLCKHLQDSNKLIKSLSDTLMHVSWWCRSLLLNFMDSLVTCMVIV